LSIGTGPIWRDYAPYFGYSRYELYVSQDGLSQFSKIEDAVAYRVANYSVFERVNIIVKPPAGVNGKYTPANPVTVPGNTEILGAGLLAITIEASDPTEHLFVVSGGNCQFRNLLLSNVTTAGKALINYAGAGTNVSEFIYGSNASIGILVSGVGGNVTLQNIQMISSVETGVKVTAGSCQANWVQCASNTTAGFHTNGAAVFLNSCRVVGSSGIGFLAENSGVLTVDSCIALGCGVGLQTQTSGIILGAAFYEGSSTTYSYNQGDSTGMIWLGFPMMNSQKMNISVPSLIFISQLQDNSLGGNRWKRLPYSSAGTLSELNTRIHAITTSGAYTLPTSTGSGLSEYYPIIYAVRDETGTDSSTVSPGGADTINGSTSSVRIPANGAIWFYTTSPGSWFTMQNNAIRFDKRDVHRYALAVGGG